jgi:FtsH-binding integral membrane protein
MSTQFELPINTGNPETDRQHLAHYEQHYRAAGMHCTSSPAPGGGYILRVSTAAPQPPQQSWPEPQQQSWQQPQQQHYQQPQQPPQQHWQQQAHGGWQPAYAAAAYQGPHSGEQAGGLGQVVGQAVADLGVERVRYLRRVYGLLAGACFVAIAAGFIAINVGPTVAWTGVQGERVNVPWLVSIMLESRAAFWACFGILVGSTFVASWVSKIRIVNVIALFAVAAIMGVQLAPMSFVALYFAGIGDTLSANPIRDAGLMTGAVFIGITAYIFVTRKDFSYLKAILNIGFWVILAGCVLTFFLKSEPFALAVASAGALLSAGFLLYVTSYIFKHSEMDDPVGDALAILVQLRNLFMFLLRIFMSSRN